MGHYQVQAPDGHTYEFEAPDDATPQQLDAMTREVAGYGSKYPVEAPKLSLRSSGHRRAVARQHGRTMWPASLKARPRFLTWPPKAWGKF
jgi:hypothetical protein